MLLSVYMPHSGRDEEDYIEALETVRTISCDSNIELKLGNADEDLQGLDSIKWYGMYGPECKGGGEDVITFEKCDGFNC